MAKGKKGKKKAVVEDPNKLTEVDKAFYELQIADLNRKLVRYKTLSDELEATSEQLREELKKVDQDRNDVVVYLKRTLNEKSDETTELQSSLIASEQLRKEENYKFKEKVIEMEEDFRLMHEQLTSEVKLFSGKLNSLEEFRTQRDDLMAKFEVQEGVIEEQELRHKKELYEIEKKFVIAKDKLKRDMEARLMQLSTEFQQVTEVRIASTTHRVIRENIAINNELDMMIATHKRLDKENEHLGSFNKTLKIQASLHREEKNMALSKCAVQYKIVEKLTNEVEVMKNNLTKYQDIETELTKCRKELTISGALIVELQAKIRILEQNLHASRCERVHLKTNFDYSKEELDRCYLLMQEAAMSIKNALSAKVEPKDKAKVAARREALLSNMLALMSKAKTEKVRRPSLDSIDSVTATYAIGDLGFVPKPVVLRSQFPTKRNIETHMGGSFQDILALYAQEKQEEKDDESQSFKSLSEFDLTQERKSVAISKYTTVIEPIRTIFDDTTSEPSINSAEEVSYHVQLQPQGDDVGFKKLSFADRASENRTESEDEEENEGSEFTGTETEEESEGPSEQVTEMPLPE